MSFDRLQKKIDEMRNPTVVGLDPALEHIPPDILRKHVTEKGESLEAAAAAVVEFNMGLIDSLCDIVPAVKPQSAYYEALGPDGALALKATCDYARSKGMYVIIDAKRNDIGSTAEAYSSAYLGAVTVGGAEFRPYDADALTVNAYLGSDGIQPFIDAAVKYDKALFALVKTSNPSACELQDMLIAGAGDAGAPRTVYAAVGDLLESISHHTIGEYGYSRVGAVVGATYPEEIEYLRARLHHTFFLIPGYGAQGGSAADVARAFDENGRGAVVNSSRAIIAAWKKTGSDYKESARLEALRMRDELQSAIL
ncbi:MAG: orotidine-5'-phosphate decarboxylase [Oscillospiraceae bacterium]|nr:orotidine-5'-phosphate decarboxylase [Oscillospiraceae bacterium]